jgi:1-acyl-sn-glycerol-3-phosphate acyltransferase
MHALESSSLEERNISPEARSPSHNAVAPSRQLAIHDAGAGFDTFGVHPGWVRRIERLVAFFYDKWFRVTSYNVHRIPTAGPVILVANHGGNLPIDAIMIWADVLRGTRPPRLVRPIGHHLIPTMPFLAPLAARMGVVGGTRANVAHLLANGELLLIFPEGVTGILKGWRKRYRLQNFTVGHAEFALRHRVPIIPVGVVGSEEQLPKLSDVPFGKVGIPMLPLPALPIPLPTHYYIRYGEPIRIYDDFPSQAADHPEVLEECAERIRRAVQALVDEGLKQRRGVFL